MSPAAQDTGALRDYARLKLELADIIRALLRWAERWQQAAIVPECRALLARLAEDRFNLAVLGQFSRGKSSLMNALLGEAKLPTGALPLTSVVTTVAYGDAERVLLQREGWAVPQEIPLDRLPEFITQAGNPGNEKRVTLAEIQLPNELLRLGVHFMDTPGIGSAVAANSRTTRQFLPQADAAIFVTSVESPLTEAELEFLAEICEHARAVFVVVNKQDLLAPSERAAVLDGIRATLHQAFPSSLPVFLLSARDALQAKRGGAAAALAASGWLSFESVLADYLRHQKAQDLLLRVAAAAAAIARRQQLNLQLARQSRHPREAAVLQQRLEERLAGLESEREEIMLRFRGRLQTEFSRHCRERITESAAPLASHLEAALRDELAHAAGAISPPPWPELLRRSFQRVAREQLPPLRAMADRLFHDLAAAESAALAAFAADLSALPAAVLGAAPALEAPVFAPTLPALALPDFEPPSARDHPLWWPPWWYEALPAGRMRAWFLRRWLRRTPALVLQFQATVLALFQSAADAAAEAMDRELRRRIATSAAQVRAGLSPVPELSDASDLDALLARIEQLASAALLGESGASAIPASLLDAAAQHSALLPCPICARVERAVMDGLARLQYDLHASETARRDHATHFGFCPLHTWQYEAIASPQGVCTAYPGLLTRLAERLQALAREPVAPTLPEAVQSLLPSAACPACQWTAAAEAVAARELTAHSDVGETGVCLFHLPRLLQAMPDATSAAAWLRAEAAALQRLAEDMNNYALKHDAIRRRLSTAAERAAAVAGLARLVGRRGVVAPWRSS